MNANSYFDSLSSSGAGFTFKIDLKVRLTTSQFLISTLNFEKSIKSKIN